jgi:hypothetical protein
MRQKHERAYPLRAMSRPSSLECGDLEHASKLPQQGDRLSYSRARSVLRLERRFTRSSRLGGYIQSGKPDDLRCSGRRLLHMDHNRDVNS